MNEPLSKTREQIAAERIARMQERLAALQPITLQIDDDGQRHIGHAGAADGHGHFRMRIVSAAFSGLSPLARHRAVYAALGEMMQTDIHALTLDARAPDET